MSFKPVLIAMVGLPRSGKSTISKVLAREWGNAPIVNRDNIRLALHGQRYQALAEPFVKGISNVMIRSLFLSGSDYVIYDETNYSRAARDFIKSPDWNTVFYVVETDPDVCVERAFKTNQPDLKEVIWEMYDRYEPLGYDETSYERFLQETIKMPLRSSSVAQFI